MIGERGVRDPDQATGAVADLDVEHRLGQPRGDDVAPHVGLERRHAPDADQPECFVKHPPPAPVGRLRRRP